jgi:hypothetical protein
VTCTCTWAAAGAASAKKAASVVAVRRIATRE